MPPLGFAKGGHKFFKGGQCPPPLGGAVKYPGNIAVSLASTAGHQTPLYKSEISLTDGKTKKQSENKFREEKIKQFSVYQK